MECLLAIARCFPQGQNNGWKAGADSAVIATLVTVAGPLDPRGGKAWRKAPGIYEGKRRRERRRINKTDREVLQAYLSL
jgi:hypothetical protein